MVKLTNQGKNVLGMRWKPVSADLTLQPHPWSISVREFNTAGFQRSPDARCALGQVEASLDDWGQVLRLGAGAEEGIQPGNPNTDLNM
jgi:hypothetical protein